MTADAPSLLIYVHEDRLGDALLKLPAMAALRAAFPGYHITWRAGCGPSIFNTVLAPLREGMLDRVQDTPPLGCSWREWLHRPAGTGHDIIIDTQTVVRSTLLLRRLPHRLFISPAMGFRLSHRRPPRRRLAGNLSRRLLQLFALAARRADLEPGPVPPPPPHFREAAARLLPAGPVYIGLAPGAGGRDKCWPLQRYLALGQEQLRRGRVPVFFLGPEERDWVAEVRAAVPGALLPEAQAGPGADGPLLAMALAGRLRLAVANDAGTGHLLAAAGTPLLSLFGRTSEEKFIETGTPRRVLRARDYSGDGVDAIPYAAVAATVEAMLQRPEAA